MAGSFVDDEPWDVLNQDARWGVVRIPPLGQMASPAFGEWAPANCSTPAATDFGQGNLLNVQCIARPTVSAAPRAVEENSAQFVNASENQLHIFCIDGDGRQRVAYRKAGGKCEALSTSRRRAREQSAAPSPSKFELAAVAALCSPTSRSPPRRIRSPELIHFPSAQSFVPGRQLLIGSSPSGALERKPASACSIPPATIRKFDRAAKHTSPAEVFTSSAELLGQAQMTRSAWLREKEMQQREQRERGSLRTGTPQQSPRSSAGSSLRCISPNKSASNALQWRDHQPGGITFAESSRSPYETMGHRLIPAPSHIAAPTNCSFTRPSHNFPRAETSFCGGSAMGPPTGPKGPNSAVQHAPLADGYACRSVLPLVKPWQTTIQKNTEDARDSSDDQSAKVVTVYGTERFWELMDILAELQRGPTSLPSSSVTFDSVLLPGGQLHYSVIEQGSFGKVFVGSHRGAKVAIKVPVEEMLSTDPAGVVERTLNEWKILSMCQHPNLIRLVGGIVHGPFDIWLVTQLASGSDLHSRKYSRDPHVRRFISPENGLYMCRQLAAVVAYLHTPAPGRKPIVVHRDIKPENVLIADDWTIQLCDFGDAEASADGRVSRISGATWFYAPAELLRCSPVECMASSSGAQLPSFNEKWDIWSMGCVFQEMFGFSNPMHVHISSRDSPSVIYEKLKTKAIAGTLVPDIAEEIQGVARNIILRCLHPDPSARPSAVEVLNMWNARDEDILKDIYTRTTPSQANVMEASSINTVNRQHFPRTNHQQLLPNIGSLRREPNLQFTSGSKQQNIGSALYGQQIYPAAAHVYTGSSGALLLQNRERDNWVTNSEPSIICSTPLVPKEGARFVQSQGIQATSGWQ